MPLDNDHSKNIIESYNAFNKSLANYAASDSVKRVLESYNSINKSLANYAASDSVKRVLESYNSTNKSLANYAASDSVKRVLESYNSINKSLANYAASDSVKRVLESYNSTNKSLANYAASDSVKRVLESYNSTNKSLANYAASDSVKRVLESYNSINKSLVNYVTSDSMKRVLDNITADKSLLETIALHSTSKAIIDYLETSGDSLPSDLESYQISDSEQLDFEPLENASNSSEFLAAFSKLPILIQIFILWFCFEFVPNVGSNVIANIITPHVEDVIGTSGKQMKEQVKVISNIKIEDIDLESYRFVTVDNLILRERAKANSASLDNLKFGQVLTVISRDRNWLEVTYNYDNGNVMHGWVFTRYTAKFKQ